MNSRGDQARSRDHASLLAVALERRGGRADEASRPPRPDGGNCHLSDVEIGRLACNAVRKKISWSRSWLRDIKRSVVSRIPPKSVLNKVRAITEECPPALQASPRLRPSSGELRPVTFRRDRGRTATFCLRGCGAAPLKRVPRRQPGEVGGERDDNVVGGQGGADPAAPVDVQGRWR